jgi:cruciform cutting endonuclease 1
MAQLIDIARLTGIRSAGPKNALIQRMNTELQRSKSLLCPQVLERPDGQSESLKNSHKTNSLGNGNAMPLMKDLSILSIDMGIQNLAFAHLLVPAPGQKSNHPYPSGPTILNAWERLAISEIPIESPSPSSFSLPLALARPQRRKRRSINTSAAANVQREAADLYEKAERLQGIQFSPEIYALRAYTLIKSLITSYRPTHILIERQRFRTGGGSAVQEWTLRVGVFEGMLHAVLHTLGRERVHCLAVHSVEPKMVTSYWRIGATDNADTSGFSKAGEKKRRTPRDVKKEKINLIGQFIATSMEDNVSKSQFSGSVKLAFGSETDLKETVDAYLQKWKGERASRGSHGSAPLGKLDDLADCLLQGVTWLEWQVMRSRVVADGVDALYCSRGSDQER